MAFAEHSAQVRREGEVVTFNPVPKPPKREPKAKKYLPRATKPIARSWIKQSGKPIKQRNEKRIAKRHAKYTAHIRSVEYLQLRYARWLMDEGYCQCEWCVKVRTIVFMEPPQNTVKLALSLPDGVILGEALKKIPVYFTKGGDAPWKRIRGLSCHHVRYDLERPKISDLRSCYPHHHAALEAKYSTRRRYITGAK